MAHKLEQRTNETKQITDKHLQINSVAIVGAVAPAWLRA